MAEEKVTKRSSKASGPVSQNTPSEDKMYSAFSEYVENPSNDIKKLSKGDIVDGVVVDKRQGVLIIDVGY